MNSTNQEAKLKTLPGPWSLGEMTGNWRDIDLPDHGGVMRIVWKMEDDEGRNDALEAQAHAVVAALNAAFSEPPAGPQAQPGTVYADLPELTSTEINDACWAFVEAMPHNLPGPIWNDLKPAVYAAICKFLQVAPGKCTHSACVTKWTSESKE